MITLTNLKEASQGFLEKLGTFKDPKESLELLLKHIRQEAISATKQSTASEKNPLEVPNLDFLTAVEILEHLATRYRSMIFAASKSRDNDNVEVETIRYINGDLLQCCGLANVVGTSCVYKLYNGEEPSGDSDFSGVPNE